MRNRLDRMPSSHLRLRRKSILALVLRLVALPRFRPLDGLRLGWPDLDLSIVAARRSVSALLPLAVLRLLVFIRRWEEAVVSDLAVLWAAVSVLRQEGIRMTKLANGLLSSPSFTLLTLLDQNV
jgi:hypothetical protein